MKVIFACTVAVAIFSTVFAGGKCSLSIPQSITKLFSDDSVEIEGRGYHGHHGGYGRSYEKVWFQSTQLSVRCRDQIPTNSSLLTVGQNPCMEPVRKIMPKIEVKISLSCPFFPDPTEHWRSIVPLQG